MSQAKQNKFLALLGAALALLAPAASWACACGCGIFDVSSGVMMPTGAGGNAWIEYDYLNQSKNLSGTRTSAKDNNSDHQIRTDFYTAGAQYMFNHSWGAQITVPYWNRNFRTDDQGNGNIDQFNAEGFGDIRLKGIYSGLSDDMSTGIMFGVKLPSGSFTTANFDRDTQIGSGSTDTLLGVYHMGRFSAAVPAGWYVNSEWQHAVSIQDHYRPGDEGVVVLGAYYDGFTVDKDGKLIPLFQLIGGAHARDRGQNAHPEDSGYTRLLAGPGLEYHVGEVKLYSDIETPIYQHVNGNQLVSPVAFKFSVSHSF